MPTPYFSQQQRWSLSSLLIAGLLALLVIFFAYSSFITDIELEVAALILLVSDAIMVLVARKKNWLFALALMVNMFSVFKPTAIGYSTHLMFLALPLFVPILLVLWNEAQTNKPTSRIGQIIMLVDSLLIAALAGYAFING